MNILLIDNESKHTNELIELARDNGSNEVEVIKYGQIGQAKIPSTDLIILSGGHGHGIINHDDEYGSEINLIRTTNKPILGICFGCELIAYAFGSRLELLGEKESNSVELEILEDDAIVSNLDKVKVHESHRWYIKNLGPELKALAKSKDGIEIIKHKSRPIYGFQFHPELDAAQGAVLLRNLTNLVK